MSWWNPVDWVKDVWGGAVDSFDGVKRWVVHAITVAVGTVERDVLDALEAGERALSYVETLTTEAADTALSAVGDVYSSVVRSLDYLEALAERLAADAVHEALSAVDALGREARALVAGAERTAQAALDAVVRDLVEPVVHFIDGIETWWAHHIDAWWHDIDRDVVQPIEHGLDVARHDVAEAGDWIAHEGAEVVRWVEHEGAYVLHFVETLVADVEHLPEEVASALSFGAVERWLSREEDSLGEDIEGLATRVFG